MARKRKPRKPKHSTRPDAAALSAHDIKFCQYYAEHGNRSGTAAYKQAGYPNSTSSDSAVGRAAWFLVRKHKIRLYIREIRQQAADAASVTTDLLAQGFKRVGFADRRGVFGPDGRMLPPAQWPDELGSIIAGIEVEDIDGVDPNTGEKVVVGRRWKVKFERSMEARKVLAQWKGMIGADATLKDFTELVKTVRGIDPDKV